MNIDEDSSKRDKDQKSDELIVPKFRDVVTYVWDQMQKRKKGSNAKHRFVIGNNVLQFHPVTYQEVNPSVLFCYLSYILPVYIMIKIIKMKSDGN